MLGNQVQHLASLWKEGDDKSSRDFSSAVTKVMARWHTEVAAKVRVVGLVEERGR